MKSKIIYNVHLCTDMLSDELTEDIHIFNISGGMSGWPNQKDIIKKLSTKTLYVIKEGVLEEIIEKYAEKSETKLMVKNKKAIPLSRIPSPNISEFTYEYMYPFCSIKNKQLPQFIIDKLWIIRDKRSKNRYKILADIIVSMDNKYQTKKDLESIIFIPRTSLVKDSNRRIVDDIYGFDIIDKKTICIKYRC